MLNNIESVTRTFYPVGQGAFYRERFVFKSVDSCKDNEVFNIVYDCGTKTAKGAGCIDLAINSWDINENLDILFISHFHNDHISKIIDLVNKTKPKTVIMPYLTDDDKNYYIIGLIDSIDISNYDDTFLNRIIEDINFIVNPKKILNETKVEDIYFIVKEKELKKVNENVAIVQEGDLLNQKDKIKILNNFKADWILDTFVSKEFDKKTIVNKFERDICKISELYNNKEKISEIFETKSKMVELNIFIMII